VSDITTAPRPPGDRELFPQLIYTLSRHDWLAWWQWEWDRAAPGRGLSRADRLLAWWLWLPMLTVALLAAAGALFILVTAEFPGARGPRYVPGVLLVGFFFVFALSWAWYAGTRPGMRAVWGDLGRERADPLPEARAREREVAGEPIDPERIHWLLVDAAGFTQARELRRRAPGGLTDYEYRELRVPWGALEEVVDAERHVFLVLGRGQVVLVPRRAFVDADAAGRFVAAARQWCAAARLAPAAEITPAHAEGVKPGP
jgi:hypothetical protein